MIARHLLVLTTALAVSSALAQTVPATSGAAVDGSPSWKMKGSFPDPGGRTAVAKGGIVTLLERPQQQRPPGAPRTAGPPGGCHHSPVCGNRLSTPRGQMQRVLWDTTLGYAYQYPIELPAGTGGVPAVALDSKHNLWVFQRKPEGMPQLFKFDPGGRLVLTVAEDVVTHHQKAHGMAVDAQDNVWILDTGMATAKKISPDGKLLQTIGEHGHPGDWDEAKGQRLLWEPVMIAFARNGDIYIAQGHGNESPNTTDSEDATNNLGVARVLHLDKTGKFIGQWFGNFVGMGKFENGHGLAIDPTNGDVWIGDREQYRIVVFNSEGKFLKTLQTRNLVCALNFDRQGNPWMASGQDGQYLKLDRNGKVLGAIGNGMGIGAGEFIEASYWVFDEQNNLWAGDTSVGRVTKMVRTGK
jgi:sugar lactone lactonase YvrE